MNTHDKKANQDALRNVCTLLECAGVPHLQGVADSETGTRLEDGMYQFSFDGNAYTVAMHSSTGQWYLGEVTARVNGALHVLPAAIAELRGLLAARPASSVKLDEPASASDLERIKDAWKTAQLTQWRVLEASVLGVRVEVDATLPANSIQMRNDATGERVTFTNVGMPEVVVTGTPTTHFERVISELASEDSDFVERIRQALAGNGDE